MSVFERYQEIGILKSMGAFPKHIFTMIWIETTLLCSIGGIIGILMAFVFTSITETLIRYFLPFAPTGNLVDINYSITILSFIAITATGIIGGIYPAWKASKVRPLDAIRSE